MLKGAADFYQVLAEKVIDRNHKNGAAKEIIKILGGK